MWQVAVYRPGQHEQFCAAGDRFVLSRNAADGRWLFSDGDSRPLGAAAMRLRVDGERLWLECRGVDWTVELASGESLAPNKIASLECPWVFRMGDAWFEVRAAAADAAAMGLEPLDRAAHEAHEPSQATQGPDADTVARWLGAVSRLHRTAANAPEFLSTAAQLTLDSTGLDAVMIITRSESQWQIAGSAVPQPQHGLCYEGAALAALAAQAKTWRCPTPTAGDITSPARCEGASRSSWRPCLTTPADSRPQSTACATTVATTAAAASVRWRRGWSR